MGEVAGSNTLGVSAADEPFDGERTAQEEADGGRLGAQLRALHSATTALAQLRAVERLPSVAASAARDGLDADVLLISLLDENRRHLRTAHVGRVHRQARQRLTSIRADGSSVIAEVARTGQAVYQRSSRDAGADGGVRRITSLEPDVEWLAVLPLPTIDGPLGVIVFGRPGARPFASNDITFVKVLAGLCAAAVERLRLATDRSRVQELLRRRRLALHAAGTQVRVGAMRIDLEQLQIEVAGRSANLTPTEMRLLMFLAEEPGRPRTRREILTHLWHTEHVGGERACDAHIWNLRRKIERDPSRPELVVTRRGVGYALAVS
jgi:DNA-binding winged helix-turn-helix (wHTH) protein